MVRIREQFKHRKICPIRVWLTLEMVGLTICYKSDSHTTIAITRSQRQPHLKHNSRTHEKQTRDTLGHLKFILELASWPTDSTFHQILATHVYFISHFKPWEVPSKWTTRSILHTIPLEEIQTDHKFNLVEKPMNHGPWDQTVETKSDYYHEIPYIPEGIQSLPESEKTRCD